MYNYKIKIKYPFDCPVCGKSKFKNYDWLLKKDKDIEVYEFDRNTGEKRRVDAIEAHFVHCEYCGWVYDIKQVVDYDEIGDRNQKTVNQLKEEYKEKKKKNSKYKYDDYVEEDVPHKCPVCGEYEFKYENSYDICHVCGWEDDGTEYFGENETSDANECMTILEWREEFLKKRKENPKYIWENQIYK